MKLHNHLILEVIREYRFFFVLHTEDILEFRKHKNLTSDACYTAHREGREKMAVITISRQFGAGGKTLGGHIAEKLGYTLIDEVLIEQVATEANVSPDWVKSFEREAGSNLLRYISGIQSFKKSYYVERLTEQQGCIEGHIYVKLLHKIISRIAKEGDVVIIGRGGQYILQNQKDVYHVLMMAEMEKRVKFMETHYDLSPRQASTIVNKQSKARVNLYRYFGKKDYDSPSPYHIVLNMSKISMEKASDCVCKLIEG